MFKLTKKKEKMNVGKMEGGELNLGMYLNESPYYFHQNGFNGSSVSSVSPGGVGPFSGGFFVSGSSPSEAPFGFYNPISNNPNGVILDNDFGLSDNLLRMHIGVDEHKKGYGSNNKILGFHPDGFGLNNQHLYENVPCNIGASAYNVDHFHPSEAYFQSLVGGCSQSSYEQNKGVFFENTQGYNMGTQGHFPVLSCQSTSESGVRGYGLELRKEQGRGFFNGGIHLQDPSINRPCRNDPLLYNLEERRFLKSQDLYKYENGKVVFGIGHPTYISGQESRGVQSCTANPVALSMPNVGGTGVCNGGFQFQDPSMNNLCCNDPSYYLQEGSFLKSQDPYRVENPKLLFSENPTYVTERSTRGLPSCNFNPVVLPMPNAGGIGGCGYDKSFILEGNGVKFVADKQYDHLRGLKKSSLNGNSLENQQEKRKELGNQNHSGGVYDKDLRLLSNPMPIVPSYESVLGLKGGIYYMAKDQIGCRLLQKKIEEGTSQDVHLIFHEIIDHVVELVMNPFGNYLIQKLIDICGEDQRMQIVLMVTEDPRVLLKICLDTHGTCSMQKLIKSLKTRQQITSLTMALEPGFLDLTKDVNGNHVLQCCLKCLGHNYNKFIFSAATKYCVEIATHRHGCCVLNQCIAHSTGKHRENLIAEVCFNALVLAQDSFGNYVVQFVVELKIPSAAATLLSQFEGKFVCLSMQKFSSHVVEKCLKYSEESRRKIIAEFLSVPYFSQLLQDPFANYVVQSALEVSKGHLHTALVQAIEAHSLLRTSPYCKKIFSGNLLKK